MAVSGRRESPPPPATTEALLKILESQQRVGWANDTAAGAVDAFLKRALAEPDHPKVLKRLIADLPRGGFSKLDPEARSQWAQSVQAALQPGAPPLRRADPAIIRRSSESLRPDPEPPSKPTPRRSSARRTTPAPSEPSDPLAQPITALGRIGSEARRGFARIGVETIYDLLWHIPIRHQDWRDVRPITGVRIGETVTVVAEVQSCETKYLRNRRVLTEAIVADASGAIQARWWGQRWLSNTLKRGARVGLSGKIGHRGRRLLMESPEWERLDDPDDDTAHVGRLAPIYPRTQGLPNRTIRRLAHVAVREYAHFLAESLPQQLVRDLNFPSEPDAIRAMHFPDDLEQRERARDRIAFQELLAIQLAVLSRRREARRRADAPPIVMGGEFLDRYLAALPFELTAAQSRALTDIRNDIARREPMARLLQGDVGSGKTVVAAAAMLAAVKAGYQTALMAPTEVLANQHFQTFHQLFTGTDDSVLYHYPITSALGRSLRMDLLTGSAKTSRKDEIRQGMESGALDLVVGTHALIQERTSFKQLGLAIVDEQHRFGVLQRDALRGKGASPHLLVMTATPIPRTLSLTIYGELDNSVINELPPGRQRVVTKVVPSNERAEVYRRIREEADAGRQSFIICPLVEESEEIDAAAATAEYERLRDGPLADLAPRMRLLHGRMSSDQKRAVMSDLASGRAQVLVSTIVVEVGVDLPNATVMAIEGADRFGLAQLHQLRGRVGRSNLPSVCYLISDSDGDEAQRRLKIMEQTADGFELAEVDLEMRGPGEYFGTRQTGLPDLRVAKLTDHALIQQARNWANRILDQDPHLRDPQHRLLAQRAASFNVAGAAAVH